MASMLDKLRGKQPLDSQIARELYFDLMKKCLTDLIYAEDHETLTPQTDPFDKDKRIIGSDWPALAHTMVGLERLHNVQFCVENVIKKDVSGDLIETGVWRGGVTIFMRAILKAYGVNNRKVWVADSFQGLPPPDSENYPADSGDNLYTYETLAVSLKEVQSNFAKYDLLDSQVQFLKGWFKDTLPSAPIKKLAVIRLDGDMYESTMNGLVNLYPKLSSGGYLIIDDYGCYESCRQAVHDYRNAYHITEEIVKIDWTGAYWQKKR